MLLLFLLLVLLSFTVSTSSTRSKLNKHKNIIHSNNKNKNNNNMYGFQWIASLHPKSGIAESLETSSSLIAAMTDDDNHNRNDKNIHDNKKISRRSECKCISSVLRNYPYWLCSFGVTFGLLKAKIVDNNIDVCIDDFISSDVEKKHLRQSINMMTNNNNVCSSAVQICTSLFGIELLTFGIPDVDDNKHQYIISSTSLSSSSRKSNAVKHDDSSAVVSMEFPVVSGLLAYKPAQGSIRFDAHYYSKMIGQKNRSSTTNEYAREARSVSDHTTVSLESRVVNYRPAIVGGAEPVVNPLRRVAYLLTQRYVHAYVMRRFHNHFHQSMQQQQHSSN